MWRKGNPLALVVGMQIDTTTLKNSMEIPFKTQNKNTKWLSDPTIGHIPEKIKIQKTHMNPNVHSNTIYNCQDIEAPRCPLIDEWIKNLWSIHTMEYCVHAQLLSCVALCNPMDCSLPGSSVHGIFPGKNIGEGCHFLLQGIFSLQGSNLCLLHLLHWQVDSLPLSHLGSPQWNVTQP